MPDDRWSLIAHLLDEAAALPAERRSAFLDTACAEDPTLRAEVASLLAHDAEAGAYFEGLGSVVEPEVALQDARVDTRLGAWKLIAPLGQGGMGTVYRAERADGIVEQTAALKLLDSIRPEVIARFEQERQILARLDHPGLAHLLDGGATPEGRPYLVMEYVDGEPITDFAAHHHLAVETRLRLFADVCEAVQAAHQRLVVHRDLKPSNIFVKADGADGAPRVKLLDFGIAKFLSPEADTDAATGIETQTDQRLLTPAYAAPEQIDGGPITTATDVYALGVVLCELLTGQRPFAEATLSAYAAAIVGGAAPRPSTLVGHAAAEALAASGLPTDGALRGTLRGDLDAICLKALRAAPEDRYRSVEALRDDVLRYLDGWPVRAREGARAYRARRFVQRHRLAVGLAAFALAALVAGLGAALWQARVAATEAELSREQARRAEATVDFMTGLFEGVGPAEARGRAISPEALVARGRDQVAALDSQPTVQAELLAVMGRLNQSLGLYAVADSLHAEALALRQRHLGLHPDVAQSLHDRAAARFFLRDFAEADSLYRAALAIRERTLPPDDPRLLESLVALAGSASNFYDHTRADSLYTLALDRWSGEAWRLHSARVQALVGQAELRADEGRLAEAESSYRTALTAVTKTYGPDHPDVADLHYALGEVLSAQARLPEAIASHQAALRLYRQLYGDTHDFVATSLYGLGRLAEKADLEDPVPYYEEAATIYAATLGREHVWAAYPLAALGRVYTDTGQPTQALRVLEEARTIYQAAGLARPDNRLAALDYQSGLVLVQLDRRRAAREALVASRVGYRALLREATAREDSAAVARYRTTLDDIVTLLATDA